MAAMRQAVVDAIHSTLGRYVIDLDASSFSVSLLSGKVDFSRGVELDADAINRDYFDLRPGDDVRHDDSSGGKKSAASRRQQKRPSAGQRRRRSSASVGSVGSSTWKTGMGTATTTGGYGHSPEAAPSSCSTSPRTCIDEDWVINAHGTSGGGSFLDALFLPLRKNVRLVSGSIAKLTVEVSWSSLISRPVVAKLSGVKLVLTPHEDPSGARGGGGGGGRRRRGATFSAAQRPSATSLESRGVGDSSAAAGPPAFVSPPQQQQHRAEYRRIQHPMASPISCGVGSVLSQNGTNSAGGWTGDRAAEGAEGVQEATARQAAPQQQRKRSSKSSSGPKVIQSIPFSGAIGKELLKGRRAREEELVRRRRRAVLRRRDERRRRAEALRRSFIPSWEEHVSKDYDVDECNEDASKYVRKKQSKRNNKNCDNSENVYGGGARRMSSSTFGDRLSRRIAENLHLELKGVHIQIVKEGSETKKETSWRGKATKDRKETRDKGFVLGISLDSLSIFTTDEDGHETNVDGTEASETGESFLFKSLNVSGFCIYLEDGSDSDASDEVIRNHVDDDSVSVATHSTQDILKMAGINLMARRRTYLINPLSFEAALRRCKSPSPESYMDDPKYLIYSQLPHLSVLLSKHQLDLANSVVYSLSPLHTADTSRPHYPEYRPACSISSLTAREWWKYAIRCIWRRKHLWVEFMLAFRKRKRYAELYKRFYGHRDASPRQQWLPRHDSKDILSPLTKEEVSEMHKLEDDRSISLDAVVQWRAIAEAQLRLECLRRQLSVKSDTPCNGAANDTTSRKRGGLFSFLSDDDTRAECHSSTQLSSRDSFIAEEDMRVMEQELVDLSKKIIPAGSKFANVEFNIGFVIVELVDPDENPIAKLRLGSLETSLGVVVGGSIHSFRFSLGRVQVEDCATIGSFFPTILRSLHRSTPTKSMDEMTDSPEKGHSGSETGPRAAFCLSVRSSIGHGAEILLQMISMEVVASLPFIETLLKSFGSPLVPNADDKSCHQPFDQPSEEFSHMLEPSSCLSNMMSSLAHSISRTVRGAWSVKYERGARWRFDCDVEAPILVLPRDSFDADATVVAIDCGRHRVYSLLDTGEVASPQKEPSNATSVPLGGSSSTLDAWKLESSAIGVFVGNASDAWLRRTHGETSQSGKEGTAGEDHLPGRIVGPLSVDVDIFTSTLESMNDGKPDELLLKIDGQISELTITFTLETLAEVLFMSNALSSVSEILFTSIPHGKCNGVAGHEECRPSRTIFENTARDSSMAFASEYNNPTDQCTRSFDCSISVCKVSIAIGGFEANGRSLHSSFSIVGGSLTEANLSLGCFWALHRMGNGDGGDAMRRILATGALPGLSSGVSSFVSLDKIFVGVDEIERCRSIAGSPPCNSTIQVHLFTNETRDRPPLPHLCNEISELDSLSCMNINVEMCPLFLYLYPAAINEFLKLWEEVKVEVEMGGRDALSFDKGTGRADAARTSNELSSNASVSTSFSLLPSTSLCALLWAKVSSPLHSWYDAMLYPSSQTRVQAQLKVVAFGISLTLDKDESAFVLEALVQGLTYELNVKQAEVHSSFQISSIVVEVHDSEHSSSQTLFQNCPDRGCNFLVAQNKRMAAVPTGGLNLQIQSSTSVEISQFKLRYFHPFWAEVSSYFERRTFLGIVLSSAVEMGAAVTRDLFQFDSVVQTFNVRLLGPVLSVENEGGKPWPRSYNSLGAVTFGSKDVVFQYSQHPFGGGGKGDITIKAINAACKKGVYLLEQPIDLCFEVVASPIDDSKAMQVIAVSLSFQSNISIQITGQQFLQVASVLRGNLGGREVLGPESPAKEKTDSAENSYTKRFEFNAQLSSLSVMCCSLSAAGVAKPIMSLKMEEISIDVQTLNKTGTIYLNVAVHHVELNNVRPIVHSKIISQRMRAGKADKFFVFRFERDSDTSTISSIDIGSFDCMLTPATIGDFSGGIRYASVLWRLLKSDLASATASTLNTSTCRLIFLETSCSEAALVLQERFEVKHQVMKGVKTEAKVKIELYRTSVNERHPNIIEHESSSVQIVDPLRLMLVISTSKENGTDSKEIQFAASSTANLTMSFLDARLLRQTLKNLIDSFRAGALCQVRTNENDDDGDSNLHMVEDAFHASLLLPSTKVTLIDDSSGYDRPLFKVQVENLLLEGERRRQSQNFPAMSSFLRQSIRTKYFDSKSRRWESFNSRFDTSIRAERKISGDKETPTTTIAIEVEPSCNVSISEQLLANVECLWKCCCGDQSESYNDDGGGQNRIPVITGEYGIENKTGLTIHYALNDNISSHEVRSGQIKYFRFESRTSTGVGVRRKYGQDCIDPKKVTIYVGDLGGEFASAFVISDVDTGSDFVHVFGNGRIVASEASLNEDGTMVLVLRSRVLIHNISRCPFIVNVECKGNQSRAVASFGGIKPHPVGNWTVDPRDALPKQWERRGIPTSAMLEFDERDGHDSVGLIVVLETTQSEGAKPIDSARGRIQLPPLSVLKEKRIMMEDVSFFPKKSPDPLLAVRVSIKVTMIHGHPCVDVYVLPRAIFINTLPLSLSFLVTSQYAAEGEACESGDPEQHLQIISPGDQFHLDRPGNSVDICICFQCDDQVHQGGISGFTPPQYMKILAGDRSEMKESMGDKLCEGPDAMAMLTEFDICADDVVDMHQGVRVWYFSDYLLCIDHTNSFVAAKECSITSLVRTGTRFTLMRSASREFCIFNRIKEGRGLNSIRVVEIPTRGNIESMRLRWGDGTFSGHCAYRAAVHSLSNTNVVHIMFEYLIENTSEDTIKILQASSQKQLAILNPGMLSHIEMAYPEEGIVVSTEVIGVQGRTDAVRLDRIGVQKCAVKSSFGGKDIGIIVVEILPGGQHARLKVRVSSPRAGNGVTMRQSFGVWKDDVVAVSLRTSKLLVNFIDGFDVASIVARGVCVNFCRIFEKTENEGERGQHGGRYCGSTCEQSRVTIAVQGVQATESFSSDPHPFMHLDGSTVKFLIKGPVDTNLTHIERIEACLGKLTFHLSDNAVVGLARIIEQKMRHLTRTRFIADSMNPSCLEGEVLEQAQSYTNSSAKRYTVSRISVAPIEICVNCQRKAEHSSTISELQQDPTVASFWREKVKSGFGQADGKGTLSVCFHLDRVGVNNLAGPFVTHRTVLRAIYSARFLRLWREQQQSQSIDDDSSRDSKAMGGESALHSLIEYDDSESEGGDYAEDSFDRILEAVIFDSDLEQEPLPDTALETENDKVAKNQIRSFFMDFFTKPYK